MASTGTEIAGGAALSGRYAFEVVAAARLLVEQMLHVGPGEAVVITTDTEADPRPAVATAQAVLAAGGRPMLITLPTPPGVGKAADPGLPVAALTGALAGADAWVEFNNQWLLYSTPYEQAMRDNPRLRYLCLVGLDVDRLVRLIGQVPLAPLADFLTQVTGKTRRARHVRITTPAGTDVTFDNAPHHPIACETGEAATPGAHFLVGQIAWSPRLESIAGTIVFDGSLVPPLGLLRQPVALDIEAGRVVRVRGGAEAARFEAWLDGFADPHMRRLAHLAYGFHPGALLTGNILEDERVWGATEWGIGYASAADVPPDGIPAVSHTDGICLASSVWLDDVPLLDHGAVVDPELVSLAGRLLRARGGAA